MRLLAPLALAVSLALALVSATGCDVVDGRVLFLRSGSADLPILVQGSPKADSLVVFVHGGPGGSGLVYAAAMKDAFEPIARRHMLAFYDQRGAGSAQGHTTASELTIAQHVRDLGDVLALLRAQYPTVQNVFLVGHSWGSALTARYLVDSAHAAEVTGWINVNGSTNFPRVMELSRQWAIDEAQARVDDGGGDAKRWRDVLAWYAKHTTLDKGTLLQHFAHVDELGGTTFDAERAGGDTLGAFFFSPYSAGAELNNVTLSQEAMADELLAFDVHPQLPALDLPALFLFGVQDGRVPVALGEEALAALGTPADDKTLIRFERSGHRPFHEEPAKFAQSVIDFVERHR